VYIFVTMLRKLLKEHAPPFVAASFDLPGRTFRDDLAVDYKANRAPMPDELAAQIPLVHRACEALGVPVVTREGFEADDVIGTLAERGTAEGYDVVIVTGDKDFFQLVRPGIRVFNPRDEGVWYDEAGVAAKFGVPPAQVVDVLALMGDAIDNVKGVPGIGEKGARELIASFGSLDGLLEHAADVPQKRYREALAANADAARGARELLRIRTDVPVPIAIDTLRYGGPSREACYALFTELGFRSLVNEYAPTARSIRTDYRLVTTGEGLAELARELRGEGRFGVALVTDGQPAVRAGIVGVAVAPRERAARYVVVERGAGAGLFAAAASAGPGEGLSVEQVLGVLGPILEDASVAKIAHDVKPALLALARHGVELGGLGLDTMLASYLLDATKPDHTLETAALDHLSYKALTEEDVRGRGAKAVPLADIAPAEVLTYAAERADLALQLAGCLAPRLAEEGLDRVYAGIEGPLVPVLAAMERAGIRLDGAALAGQSQHIERELASLTAKIVETAGEPFNINSPPQLSRILFEKLQLPALRRNPKTRTPSTAVEVLEELALAHDLPRLILEWRALQKLKGTYVDALPQLVNPETGRVHTSFNQAVAATGRLSSSDPNLQNIPIRTELGREIRRAFIADPGHVLISADYSQIELRVLAHLSGDETLIEAFRRGDDIHDQTALKVFGTSSGLERRELRRRAKIINFAVLYGKTPFTLAKDIGVSQEAAQQIIDAYFAGFPKVRPFIERTLSEARASGVVKTLFGRQRRVPELGSPNQRDRAAAEREAVNMPIQGTAADIMKMAMIAVHAALDAEPGARMILTVHDELLLEVPEGRSAGIAALVRDRMETAAPLAVPLTVDVGIGANWRDAKP
jgi:DNA polymerase-1